jgi:hypothetical protein
MGAAVPATGPQNIEGLTGVVAKAPERVAVRMRANEVTLSAWRLEAMTNDGPGAIVVVEPSPNEVYYRGEGAFLGWPQQKLATVYQALLPQASDESLEMPQLG